MPGQTLLPNWWSLALSFAVMVWYSTVAPNVIILCVFGMTGDDSARWPTSIPAGGGAQGSLLIPVSSSELGVVCGGVKTKWWKWVRHVEERSVKQAVRWDDVKEGAQVCNTSKSCHEFDFSHTHACTCEECYQVRLHSQDWEKCCVRRGILSSTLPVAHKEIAIAWKPKLLEKNLRMRKNLAKWLPQRFCKESVAFPLFTTCDLAIGCLGVYDIAWFGVHASESLDVLCCHQFLWRWWRGRRLREIMFSKFDSSMLLRLILSFFGVKKFCHACSCRRLARIFVVGLKSFLALHWFSLTILIVAHQRDGVPVPMPLMPGCGKKDVDCREVVQVSAISFCPSVGLLRISILCILLPPDYDGVLLCFHAPLLASIAFQWSWSHWVSPCFLPLERFTLAKQ